MYRIRTMNKISPEGLELFPRDKYEVASDLPNPDAILVRSAELHEMEIPETLKAIARAGAGYNNIPVAACTDKGIVVFNTPGGNANAVKELAIASLLISSRKIFDGIAWAKTIADRKDEVPDLVEKGKSKFEGPEIKGKTLGVIGLGAIGVMVANDAIALGMDVIGFDPFISVDAAWNLSRSVKRADTLESLLMKSDYVTLHVPLSDATKGTLDAGKFRIMKKGARVLNLARGGLVNEADMIVALNEGRIGSYVTDFPSAELLACPGAICVPHLGASTPEAEDNCAMMAVRQLMDFLESGSIRNSVNFPHCRLDQRAPYRLIVANRNIPNMVGQITTILAGASINITDMINHHRDDHAINLIDTENLIPPEVMEKIAAVDGIIRVRTITKS
ncbi:MAG: 3-phosphoglycerate dehydrogenase [Treponema sp. GWB1_62_6]|nr:MAG: 3-phosphoglycerate dehydrogenase [Treponema sp. GWC1_61_84]OHE67151.1 MAG: 3-phosphoglycerate dehydrogenase [Treponema sp. GWA1_62_8]OHE67161.1 MAG: 3-phosphoglycerate dehydrogenase [Treponema sp. GWB1_62_6]OHE68339.1 MAG: 3-phosphoglycerate dehydrogenase [Treponema sp. RIFOXYC1_FULL_61_9]HCM26922.1 3-phosphoglycerate dehydrogenase [Treponema sp.]